MAREDEIKAILDADVTLDAILTGGIHTSGTVGLEGITRDTTPTAFSGGYLLPCALVRQRSEVPTGDVVDYDAQLESVRQIVEIWLYQDRGYTAIDAAATRIHTLLFGEDLDDSFELRPVNKLDRLRDPGALAGASMARIDWQIDSIIQ